MSRTQVTARVTGATAPSASRSPAVVMTGMHRSGTSLLASYLAALGIDMGSELLPADERNRHGYYEDTRFLDLHKRLLRAATSSRESGHPDWGWTESETLDEERVLGYRDRARALLQECGGDKRPWGFKDPRTAVLLDFWDGLLVDSRYVLLYRFPWDVADSMQRLGATVFLENPEYAYSIWCFYNRRLLDFYRRHRERSLLISINALVERPRALRPLLRQKLGLDLKSTSFDSVYRADSLQTLDGSDPLIGLVANTTSACTDLLGELDAEADLSSRGLWRVPEFPGTGAKAQSSVDLSVVIPCRDHGEFLLEAVASVERSIKNRYELIVVNDGSTQPRTLSVLDTLRNAGYRIIDQPGSGLSPARNRGMAEARGRYLLPLDADNRLLPGFVEAAIDVLDADSSVGVVHGSWQEFGRRTRLRRPPEFEVTQLLPRNRIDACAVVRRSLWSDLGGYDAALTPLEDWDLWLRAGRAGWRFHRLDQVTFEYRVRPNSLIHVADDDEVRGPIVDRIVARQREVYEPYISRRLGAILARWLWWALDTRSRLNRDLSDTRTELEQSKTEASEMHRKLRGRKARIDELEMTVDRLEVTEARLRDRLREREGELTEVRDSLVKTEEELAGTTRTLAGREQELKRISATLGRRELELAQITAALDDRERELARTVEELAERRQKQRDLTRSLDRQRHEFARLKQLFERRGKRLLRLDDRLNTRAAAFATLERGVRERKQQVSQLEESLDHRDRELEELRSWLTGTDAERDRLRGQVAELEAEIQVRDRRLERLEGRLAERRRMLDQIHSSHAFRLVRAYWRISSWLLPPNSGRRRLLERFLRRAKR